MQLSRQLQQMQSVRSAMLTHVVGISGRAVRSDLAAARLYHPREDDSLSYLGARRITLSQAEEDELHQWMIHSESVLAQLLQASAPDDVVSLQDAPPRQDSLDPHFRRTIQPRIEAHDVLAMRCAVRPEGRLSVIFMRCGDSPAFAREKNTLRKLLDPAARSLERAVALERAEAGGDDHTPMSSLERSAAALARLSRTEQRVLRLLCNELTERDIAARLKRSPHTVHVHVRNIYRKMDVKSRPELFKVMARLGAGGDPRRTSR